MYRGNICFDFDGVIHSYTSGWQGNNVAEDPPVPGIIEVMQKVEQWGFRIYICSSRCLTSTGLETVQNYCDKYGVPYYDITPYKPAAKIYVDDRAICFDGNAKSLLKQIKTFKSYLEDENEDKSSGD